MRVKNYQRVVQSGYSSAAHTWEYLMKQAEAIIVEAQLEHLDYEFRTLVIELPDRVKLGYSINIKLDL